MHSFKDFLWVVKIVYSKVRRWLGGESYEEIMKVNKLCVVKWEASKTLARLNARALNDTESLEALNHGYFIEYFSGHDITKNFVDRLEDYKIDYNLWDECLESEIQEAMDEICSDK